MLTVSAATWEPASQDGDEKSFRYRAETVDSVFRRAKAARTQRKIDYSAYTSIVGLLRAEEVTIYAEAKAHPFQDLAESNYWRRGRLKFPSSLETEIRRLGEGHDPAIDLN
jgi:hypothetical protein